jgi:hypothetical protein
MVKYCLVFKSIAILHNTRKRHHLIHKEMSEPQYFASPELLKKNKTLTPNAVGKDK